MCEQEQPYSPSNLYTDPQSSLFPSHPKDDPTSGNRRVLPPTTTTTTTDTSISSTDPVMISSSSVISVKILSLAGGTPLSEETCELSALPLPFCADHHQCNDATTTTTTPSPPSSLVTTGTMDILQLNQRDLQERCSMLLGGTLVFRLILSCRVVEVDSDGRESAPFTLPLSMDDTNGDTSNTTTMSLFDAVLHAYHQHQHQHHNNHNSSAIDDCCAASANARSISPAPSISSDVIAASKTRLSQFYAKEASSRQQPLQQPLLPTSTTTAAHHHHQSQSPLLQGSSAPSDLDDLAGGDTASEAPSSVMTMTRAGSTYDTSFALPNQQQSHQHQACPKEVRFQVSVVPMGALPAAAPHVMHCLPGEVIHLPVGFDVHDMCPTVDENPLSTGFTRRAFSAMIKNARRSAYTIQPTLSGFSDAAHEEEPAVQRSCLGIAENLRRNGPQLLAELQALQNTLQRGMSSRPSTPASSSCDIGSVLSSSLRQSPMEAKVALLQLCLSSIEDASSEKLLKVKQDLHTLMEIVSCSSSVALEALSVTDGNMENSVNMMLSNPLLASQSAEQLGRFAMSILDYDAISAVCDERYLRGSNHHRRTSSSRLSQHQQQQHSTIPASRIDPSRVQSSGGHGGGSPSPNLLEECRDALLTAGFHPEVVAPLTRIANGKVEMCRLALSGDTLTQRRVVQRSEDVGWYGLFVQQVIARWSTPGGASSPPRAGHPGSSAVSSSIAQDYALKETYFPCHPSITNTASVATSTTPSHTSNGMMSSNTRGGSSQASSRGPPIRGGIGGLGAWSDYSNTNVESILEAIVIAMEIVTSMSQQAEGVSAMWHSPRHHQVMKVACQAFVDYIVASSTPRRVPVSNVTSSSSRVTPPASSMQRAAGSPTPNNNNNQSQVPHSVSNRSFAASPPRATMVTSPSLSSASNRPSQSAPPPLPSTPTDGSPFALLSTPGSSVSNRSIAGLMSRSTTPLERMSTNNSPPTTHQRVTAMPPHQSMPDNSWGSTGNLSSSHRFTVPRMSGPPALPQSPPSEE